MTAAGAADEVWTTRSDTTLEFERGKFRDAFVQIFGYAPVWRGNNKEIAFNRPVAGSPSSALYEFRLSTASVTLVGTSASVEILGTADETLDLSPLIAARMPQADALVYTEHDDPMHKSYAYSAYIRANTHSQLAETVCSISDARESRVPHTADTGTNQAFYAPRTAGTVLLRPGIGCDQDVLSKFAVGATRAQSVLRSKGYERIFMLEPMDELTDADCDVTEYGRYVRRLAVVIGVCQMLRSGGELHVLWPAHKIGQVSADLTANCTRPDAGEPIYTVCASTTGIQSIMIVSKT